MIFLLGPTSSGKTATAIEVAEKTHGEIVSCDSMQIYRGMEVLTRAPGKEELSRAKHHLVGELSPEEEFNAALFAEKASKKINEILAEGKPPVCAGGAGMYMSALIDGIFESPFKDEGLRGELNDIAEDKGGEYLLERLKAVDPSTAEVLHPNNVRKIIRALEVYELTGRGISDKKKESEGIGTSTDCRMLGIYVDRKELVRRIGLSVEKMFREGVVEEVRALKGKRLSLTAKKALGMKEISAYLEGRSGLDETKELIKINTRKYAKRQMTWFRGDSRIVWVDGERPPEVIAMDILDKARIGAVNADGGKV